MIHTLYATFETLEAARQVAGTLVAEKLIACANILPGATSVYRWEAQVQEDGEVILFAKTCEARVAAAVERLAALHSYDVPCVTAWPVAAGHPPYLAWVRDEVSQ